MQVGYITGINNIKAVVKCKPEIVTGFAMDKKLKHSRNFHLPYSEFQLELRNFIFADVCKSMPQAKTSSSSQSLPYLTITIKGFTKTSLKYS